jgi:hypothetical protein
MNATATTYDPEKAQAEREAREKRANTPSIGDLATYYIGSDCYPYTVVAISKTGYKVTLQARKARRVDSNGYGGEQRWITVEDPEGATMTATRRKDGRYRSTGATYYGRVAFGSARMYQDPCF